jgi:hypothetical protein
MPSIELSQMTFTRLQQLAAPFVDTPETVIIRLLDQHESAKEPQTASAQEDSGIRRFNADAAPDLTHTKVLTATLGTTTLERGQNNWNGLLNEAVRIAARSTKAPAELKKLVHVNFVEGEKTDEGYHFLPDIGISVQGQDANGAWRAVNHILQQLNVPFIVQFVWREKEGAAHPGAKGKFMTFKRRG